jgi:hypothetical protein
VDFKFSRSKLHKQNHPLIFIQALPSLQMMRHLQILALFAFLFCTSCGPTPTSLSTSSNSKAQPATVSPEEQQKKDRTKTLQDRAKKLDDEAKLVQNHITQLYDKANIHVYASATKLRGEALRDQYRVLSLKRVLKMGKLDPLMETEILKWESEYANRWEYAETGKRDLENFQQTGQWVEPAATPPLDTSEFTIPEPSNPSPSSPSATSQPRSTPPTPDNFNPMGKTEGEVTEKWGQPTGRVEIGAELQLIYPQGRITIEDDKVTGFKPNEP